MNKLIVKNFFNDLIHEKLELKPSTIEALKCGKMKLTGNHKLAGVYAINFTKMQRSGPNSMNGPTTDFSVK